MTTSIAQRSISLREANQGFAKMVREVEAGASYTITRKGRPVATITPTPKRVRELTPEQEQILVRMEETAKSGLFKGSWKFDRDELHER